MDKCLVSTHSVDPSVVSHRAILRRRLVPVSDAVLLGDENEKRSIDSIYFMHLSSPRVPFFIIDQQSSQCCTIRGSLYRQK